MFGHYGIVKRSEISELLLAPSESLNFELKAWLNLESVVEQEKVARELIALRNQNGGILVFGFDDESLEPLALGRPKDVVAAYHQDKVQKVVKDFIEPPFEAKVHFAERDGQKYPVIEVPSGVLSPAIARRGGEEIRQYAVYMRSVHNGLLSSTMPRSAEDWDSLMRICFDNREADIARFFRRHIAGIAREVQKMPELESPSAILDEGAQAYSKMIEGIRGV